eukprot:TRINITY_DN24625_c0_g1_i1.p1 TRINITY_DN24625_c0_g1~~TRINITY_DN24625_c0_g1_i1.p1  ORF type:complete len:712 (+),score=264.29 TRINITY_DN24625_c0_g1_i1:96-2231(+)
MSRRARPGKGRRTEVPNVTEVGAGLAADVAVAGLRYVENERQRKTGRATGLDEVLNDLEAHRGIGMGLDQKEALYDAEKLDGNPSQPTKGQALYNAILSDMMMEVNSRIAACEAEEAAAEEKGAENPTNIPDTCVALAKQDCRFPFFYLLVGIATIIAGWHLALFAIARDLDCSHLNDDEGRSQCTHARELVRHAVGTPLRHINCSDYTCAAPWIPAPKASYCTACNCGATCERCHECICTISQGFPEERQQCFSPKRYPDRIEWVSVFFWAGAGAFLCIAVSKIILSSVVDKLTPTEDKVAEQKMLGSATQVPMKDLLKLKQDLTLARIGGDAWKQAEPRKAFVRRMKAVLDRADYQRLVAGSLKGKFRGDEGDAELFETLLSRLEEATGRDDHLVNIPDDNASVRVRTKSPTRSRRVKLDGSDDAEEASLEAEYAEAEDPFMQPYDRGVSPGVHPLQPPGANRRADGIRPLAPQQDVFDPNVAAWLDDNERQMVVETKEFFNTVQSAYGKVPNRVELYTALVEGQPPATSLTRKQIDEMILLLEHHPRRDLPCTLHEFVNEWMEIQKEVYKLDFWAESESTKTESDPGKHGFRNNPDVKNVLHMVRILSNPNAESEVSSSTTESFSDDEEDQHNTLRVVSKHIPYLLALFRGTPPPTKTQAAQQRQAILAATQGLHSLATAGGGIESDTDGSTDDDEDGHDDRPLLGGA